MKKAQLKELIKKSHMKEGSTIPWLNQDKNTSEDTLDTLEAKLKAHNWFHYQSDGRVYDEGMAQKREIQGILKNLESKGLIAAAKELYNKYAPYEEGSFDLRLTEEDKQDDENHKHIYKQIDPDGTAECTICGLRNSDPSKTGEKVVAESTWSTGTYTEIKRFVSDLDMLKDKYYNIVGSDDVFDGLDRAATAAEELMRNAPENRGELAENYYPSVRAYNVIDGDRNIVYKNLPRHTAIEKAGEREDYKFTATDSLAEDLDVGHEDNEPHMLKADLYRIGKYAMELYQMMDEFEGKGEVDFPHWWQSKIINAKSNLVGAKHYLDFEVKEPAIDAMVGVASDEEILDDEAPMMESAYDYVKTPKEYVALQLSDFFRVPKDKLMSFNLDGTDNIDALTKALNSTSNQGTEMYLKMSMKSAQEHFDSSMMNEVKEPAIDESADTKYAVMLTGGSIGDKPRPRDAKGYVGLSIGDEEVYTLDKAKEKAKRMNKALSPGEKSYYKLKYVVVPVANGKFIKESLNEREYSDEERTYWHVIEDVDGEKGWQGFYNTKEEAKKRADSLQDMFPRSFFYVEASDSEREPVDITLEEASTDYAKRRKNEKDLDYPKAYKKDPNYSASKDKSAEKSLKSLKEVKNSVLSKLLGTKG